MAQARLPFPRQFPFHRRSLLCAAAMLTSCGGGEQSPEPSAQQSLKRPQAITAQQASLAKWSAPIDLKMVAASGSVLANGKLLLWAGDSPQGFGGGGRTISALFDPVSNALTSRNVTETGHEMFCPGTARLPDGRLMVNGGVNAKTTSIYDPVSNVWTGGTALDMKVGRGYNASVPLSDGSVLTVGGSWAGGVAAKAAEQWTAAGGWRLLSGISTSTPGLPTSDVQGLYRSDNHMWLIPTGNGRVLHAGPSRNMHWLDVTGNGSLTPAGWRGDDTDSMSGNAVSYEAGKVLTVGGAVNYLDAAAKSDAFVLDIKGGSVHARRVANMAYPRVYANGVVLPNGQVVVIGGQTFGQPFSNSNAVLPAELFDPQTETFTVLPAMTKERNYHSIALLMPDGRVASAGGGLCNCAGDQKSMEILSPPYLFNADGSAATRPVVTAAPGLLAYGAKVTVSTNSPITSFSMVRLGATTHTVDNDQRRVSLSFTAGAGNSYQVAVPSNPGIALPGQWMLFAMNAQGTPSVAKIVTLSADQAPVLQNPGDATAVLGQPLSIAVKATTPVGSLSFSARNLPAGLGIDTATGEITGTATVSGSFLVSVLASNGSQTTSTDLLINVTVPGTGTGLLGHYFSNTTLSGPPSLVRVEAVNGDWVSAAPAANLPVDRFSARWTGALQASVTGSVQLQTRADDGVRVWLDNRLVIDNWAVRAATTDTATVQLVAGRRYPITVEYFEESGLASMQLQWQLPGSSAAVPIPIEQLYPSAAPSTVNQALGRPTNQSSTLEGGAAKWAVDGFTSGTFSPAPAVGGITHTASAAARDWWQVDLGRPTRIDLIQLWNRTECCAGRLANFTVFVSANNMSGRSFDQLMVDPTVVRRQVGTSRILPNIGIPVSAVGRHVRVQLNGWDHLSLAEVQVFGVPAIYRTPTIDSLPAQRSMLGSEVQLAVRAADLDGNPLSFSTSGLPPGLFMDAATGDIGGTATAAGNFNVTVVARNGGDLSASTTFGWTVTAAPLPVLNSFPVPSAVSGGSVAYAPVMGPGAESQFSWNFGDGTGDTAFADSPAIRHAYEAPGVYNVTLTWRSSDGRTSVHRFVQTVLSTASSTLATASSSLMLEPRPGASARLWVVNPDNDSVSVFDTATHTRLREIAVGRAPSSLALGPDGRIWVANKRSATLSILSPSLLSVVQTLNLPRASQPHGILFSKVDGSAFVVLEATGQLLKLNGTSGAKLASLAVGNNPRHLALNGAGNQLLLSRFISEPLPGEATTAVATVGSDEKPVGGEVLTINPATLGLVRRTVLSHSERSDSQNQARGLPNYLGAPAISPDGRTAWVPSKQDNVKRGVLRDGNALDFQNTVRAISSRIDLGTGLEDATARIDHDNSSLASAAVFHPNGAYLFVALETSRQLAVVDAAGRRELLRVDVGFAPQGLVVSDDGLRLYVSNFMARSVSVLNLAPLLSGMTSGPMVVATLSTVATDKLTATVLRGKQLFYDAKDPRLARDSYMSCASCHEDGGHDGRTWDLASFGEGLRNTISLRGHAGARNRLHWSGNFDEVQDFEGQIRKLAGGTGLMTDADFNAGTRSRPLGDRKDAIAAKAPDLEALAAYVNSLTRFDPSPARAADGSLTAAALAGRTVFGSQCASCHAGADFTDSGKRVSHNIGTLKKPTSGTRLGSSLNGIDTPTLRDAWATAPYLHDGSAPTIEDAVKAHRGLALSAADLAAVSAYTRQIGADEPTLEATTPNLVLHAAASLALDSGAHYQVMLDGKLVREGQIDSTDLVYLGIDVPTIAPGARIDVVFLNDHYANGEDRNLRVQSITVNRNTTLRATGSGVTIDQGLGLAAFDGIDVVTGQSTDTWIPWNAAIRFQAPGQVVTSVVKVRAGTTFGAGVGANIELFVNGQRVGSRLLTAAAVSDINFTVPEVKLGDRIDVVFNNDYYANGEDRNLFIESVSVAGRVMLPTAEGVVIDIGPGMEAFDGLDLVPGGIYGGWIPWDAALRLVVK